MSFIDLFKNFFTHKDFLPPPDQIPGTMFTWLHLLFAASLAALIIFLVFKLKNAPEKTYKKVLIGIWIAAIVLEPIKIIWESFSGREVNVYWQGMMPLYACSMFMYVLPLYIWGRGMLKHAACGYLSTLCLIGAAINFVYPVNVVSSYSCISFAGFHTLFYHGAMLLVSLLVFARGDNRFTNVDSLPKLLVPMLPAIIFSIPVNIVNFTIDADYMFFRLRSFILAPIGAALPLPVCVILVYLAYILIHTVPYLPSFIKHMRGRTVR